MEQISNVATQAAYADALTLGPLNYEAISVNVWNNSCVSQVYELGNGGDYQTGNWGAESLEAANSTFTLGRCGGVRFRDNPDTPGVHARIVAYAWQAGNVQKVGGIQLAGILSSTGNVAVSAMITGGVSSAGAATSGTGFTSARISLGIYEITFSTAFAATPKMFFTRVDASIVTPDIVSASSSGSKVRVRWTDGGGGVTDVGFDFAATATV